MERLEISVSDYNDSYASVELAGRHYLLRFTYNDRGGYWMFGVYTPFREPIAQGIKVVPRYPLTLHVQNDAMPDGIFGVYTELEKVGRRDFIEGRAIFAFVAAQQAA